MFEWKTFSLFSFLQKAFSHSKLAQNTSPTIAHSFNKKDYKFSSEKRFVFIFTIIFLRNIFTSSFIEGKFSFVTKTAKNWWEILLSDALWSYFCWWVWKSDGKNLQKVFTEVTNLKSWIQLTTVKLWQNSIQFLTNTIFLIFINTFTIFQVNFPTLLMTFELKIFERAFLTIISVWASENSIQYWRRKSYDRRLDALKNDLWISRDENFQWIGKFFREKSWRKIKISHHFHAKILGVVQSIWKSSQQLLKK